MIWRSRRELQGFGSARSKARPVSCASRFSQNACISCGKAWRTFSICPGAILHFALVLLGRFARRKGAEIAVLAGLLVILARIEPIGARLSLRIMAYQ
jgi:hypothetical protein